MNPPTDPIQLLIYGIGTIIVVFALKLWDRRRDGKLQRAADSAVQHAAAAEQHASSAEGHASAAVAASESRASGAQAESILQNGHDANATLLQVMRALGRVEGKVDALEKHVSARIGEMEQHLDTALLPTAVRRRQDGS